MKILTNKQVFPKDEIAAFMGSLGPEKDFFFYTTDDILNSEVLIYEKKNGKIVGIAGFRPYPGIMGKLFKLPMAYIAVRQEFQGQSMGRKLFDERYREARKRHNFLINTTDKRNIKMLRLMKKLDHRILGETKDRYYFFKPFNRRGVITFYALKPMFKLFIAFRQ